MDDRLSSWYFYRDGIETEEQWDARVNMALKFIEFRPELEDDPMFYSFLDWGFFDPRLRGAGQDTVRELEYQREVMRKWISSEYNFRLNRGIDWEEWKRWYG
jgi:hypothetical protein